MNMLVKADINVLDEAELARIAKDEFQEDDQEMEEAVTNIQKWIQTCPHLADNVRQDKQFLRQVMASDEIESDIFFLLQGLLQRM